MGTALTYARRYSLFALVGIAGEDDLDAPDLIQGAAQPHLNSATRKVGKALVQRSTLNAEESDALRMRLLGEISAVRTEDELLKWAQDGLKKKNTLIEADARVIELAYRERLDGIAGNTLSVPGAIASGPAGETTDPQPAELAIPKEPMRRRNKTHLLFVRGQPCLICKRSPCDAHHIKFAQSTALGRKVSDEFTVPLCRGHHREVHRCGDEAAWWDKAGVNPSAAARALWLKTRPLPTRLGLTA